MPLRKKGKYWYRDSHTDLQTEIVRYSQSNKEPATRFVDVQCSCGSNSFSLFTDENAGVAQRHCTHCKQAHWMGDSEDYLEEAEIQEHICLCDTDHFELTIGCALYRDSNDVKWVYIGCRCPQCGLLGIYADWSCEYENVDDFLSRM